MKTYNTAALRTPLFLSRFKTVRKINVYELPLSLSLCHTLTPLQHRDQDNGYEVRTPGPTHSLSLTLTNLSLSLPISGVILSYTDFSACYLIMNLFYCYALKCLSLLFKKFYNAILLCLFSLYLTSTIMSQILTLLDLAGSVKK